jgi:hypothetical protein
MQWILFADRKPPKSDYYYWKGKRGGGYSQYWEDTGEFEFPKDIAVNYVSEEHLYWLDEGEGVSGLKAEQIFI